MVIEDEHGERWVVDEGGRVSKGSESGNVNPVLDNPDENNEQGVKPKETEFMAHQDKTYGFDNTKEGEVWQSIELARSDKVTYNIKPDSTYTNVYFHGDPSHALSVSPDKAESANQELTVTSLGIEGTSEVVVSVDSIKGAEINKLNVQVYPKKRLNLRIIILHEENDDIQEVAVGDQVAPNTICISSGVNNFLDTRPNWVGGNPNMNGDDEMDGNGNITAGVNGICETEALSQPLKTTSIDMFKLRDVLNNKVYNQAVFEWNVQDITELTVNWDQNRNQTFEIFDYNQNLQLVPGKECRILDSVLNGSSGLFYQFKKDYFMIISDHSEPVIINNRFSDPYGCHLKRTRYAFTFGSKTPDTYLTIAHELGHSAFGFEDNAYKAQQALNLMNHVQQSDYTKRIWLLKEQWDKVQEIGK